MILPRAIVGGVYGMARPSRPPEEAIAVVAAAKSLRCRSVHAKAEEIARRVVADALAYLDLDLSDPLIAALAELEAQTAPTPIMVLARCPRIDTAGEITEARVDRYRARGGRQLEEADRQRETVEIAAKLERRLAVRYAKHLRK